MKQDSTPLGQALERLESILEQASRQAKSFRLKSEARSDQTFAAVLITKELAIRDAISENCREWILTGNLRPMEEASAYLFFQRLEYGEKLIRWLRSDAVNYGKSANDALLWVLVDSWDYVSRPMWLDDLKLD
jgi:hypothetical protein